MALTLTRRGAFAFAGRRWFVRTVTTISEAHAEKAVINDEDQILALDLNITVGKCIQQINAFAKQSLNVIAVLLGGQSQEQNERVSQVVAIKRMVWTPSILRHTTFGLSPLYIGSGGGTIVELPAVPALLNEPLQILQLCNRC